MASDNQNNASLGWFLAGIGLGALIGVLYAPKSGRETRESLASSAKEGSEILRVRAREAAEQVGSFVERGKTYASDYTDKGREAVAQGRAQWEEFVDKGKTFVNDQTTRISAAVEAGRHAYQSSGESSES